MAEVDYSKLDDDFKKKLAKWEANNPANQQLQVLSDLAIMMQEQLNVLDAIEKGSQTNAKDHGRLLIDMKEKLDSLNSKEAPEMPDYAEPVMEGFKDLKTALTASIKAIDVKPDVKVEAPSVSVESPKVDVDLKGVEKALKTDLPKAFEKAVKAIPQPKEIKQPDYTKKFDEMLKVLADIDTASRLKPQFPVTQLNQIKTGIDSIVTNTAGTTNYTTRIEEDSVNSNYTYIGNAVIGSAEASAVWQIKRLDATTGLIKLWSGGTDDFDKVWNNRESGSYS